MDETIVRDRVISDVNRWKTGIRHDCANRSSNVAHFCALASPTVRRISWL